MDDETTKWIRYLRPVTREPLDIHVDSEKIRRNYPELKKLIDQMLKVIRLKMEAACSKISDSGTTTKAYLEMIPVHLVEYTNVDPNKSTDCPGQVLVAGSPPRVLFILRHRKIKIIEQFAKR